MPMTEASPSPVPQADPALPSQTPEQVDEATRMEQFATLYAMGTPIPEALKIAGYSVSQVNFGYRLLHHPEVIRVVDEVRAWRNEKLAVNLNDVLHQLQRDRDFAYAMSNPAAAIQASSMIGKILGALEPGPKTPAKITIVWGGDDDEAV